MRKVARNHRVFVLDFGYDHDHMYSSLVMRHPKGFTPWDALKDIGEAFLEVYREDLNGCCGNKSGLYCSDCGTRLTRDPMLSEVEDWILEFVKSTVDGGGRDICDALRKRGWEIGVGDENPFTKGFVHVNRCAESLIAAAALGLASGESYRTDGQDKIKIR